MSGLRFRVVFVVLAFVSTLLYAAPSSGAQQGATCGGLPATLTGPDGDDVLNGTAGNDVIVGLGGNDIIHGFGGRDILCGGPGRDRLFGGRQSDQLYGGDNGDLLKGESGIDMLFGEQGNDRLVGGAGDDWLSGGRGRVDRLYGRTGFDTCDDSQAGTTSTTCEILDVPGRMFVDEFNGSLQPGWGWLFEDGEWSLGDTPGTLEILAQDWPFNVPVRAAPDGPYRVSTLLHFRPTSNFQIAGLVVMGEQFDDRLVFGRAFCEPCGGHGAYIDSIENGQFVDNRVSLFDSAVADVYLSLVIDGRRYTGYYSEDGVNWTAVGSFTRRLPGGQVGLIAAQSKTATLTAQFESFTINDF